MTNWAEKDPSFKGRVTVNRKDVDLEYQIKDGDYIMHHTVREETPIYDVKPAVLVETKDYVVVDKPSSMPVHACGNFKLNTLQGILENDMGYRNHDKKKDPDNKHGLKGEIKTVHRLDRQTSGIVFFAKCQSASNRFRGLMLENKISKVYYARVGGDFSKCPGNENNEVFVENMIYCISHIDALWDCCDADELKFEYRQQAKEAATRFKFKFYDQKSDMSVIKCYP